MDKVYNLAIIPARSGSKGLKDKNIKLLMGKPLLVYSVEAAIASGVFDEVMVSTDSEKYAEIAISYGAKVPFLRSAETSADTSSSWDVVREVLSDYSHAGRSFDTVALLQPTSPLRTAEDICQAYRIFTEKNANAVIGVCEVDHSPLWCNTLPKDLSLTGFIKKEAGDMPRQMLKTYYRINGGIYIVKTDYIKQTDNIYEAGSYAYIMDKMRSVDIDDELDFAIAETVMTSFKEE